MERKLAIKWVLKNCKFAVGNPFAFDPTPPKRGPVAPKAPIPQAAPAQAPYSYKTRSTPTTPTPTQTGDPNLDSQMQLKNLLRRIDIVPFDQSQKQGIKRNIEELFRRDPMAAEKAVIKHESYGLPARMDGFVRQTLKADKTMWDSYQQAKNISLEKALQWIKMNSPTGIQFQG